MRSNKTRSILTFAVWGIIWAAALTVPGQIVSEPVLEPNKPMSVTIRGGEERTLIISRNEGEFIELSWEAADGLELEFSLLTPAGEDLLKDRGYFETMTLVAPTNGPFKFIVKLASKTAEGDLITSPQKITLTYSNSYTPPSGIKPTAVRTVNGYQTKIFNDPDGESFFTVEQGGKLKWIVKGDSKYYFADDNEYDQRSARMFRQTADKTGDGNPDIAVRSWSGGAHCCFGLHFFELGRQFRAVPPIMTGDAEVSVVGRNPKGGLRLKTADSAFAYWNTSFAASPFPDLILDFQKGEWRPNFAAMKKQAPTKAQLAAEAAKIRPKLSTKPYEGVDVGYLEEVFWGTILDLIYAGNESAAWDYLDLVWPEEKPGKERFKADLQDQLGKSRFWRMITEDGAAQ
ncbi:MAG: hypothetical protein IPM25_02325 [Chloracidobacterium sp.]|nr:hypothetical protein [Chloracidobacterium sp.]